MTNLEQLCNQVDEAKRAWLELLKSSEAATSARDRVRQDIDATKAYNTWWVLQRRYMAAIAEAAAEEEQNDPEGVQNHPDGPEVINS